MMVGYDHLKRVFDTVAASAAIVVLSPVIAGVALAVRRKLGAPVMFRQRRPGLNGKDFTILKFRTMLEVDEAKGRVTNEQRVHPFGELLRSTSLDELPSLWNVIRGEMSLVGPRPLRTSYLARYSDAQGRRHMVRPGLTGLAQVSGRNNLSWDEKLALDQYYVDHRGPLLDARILLATVVKTLRREGISQEGQATMSEFFGPERTERLHLVSLAPEHLPTRVDWLRSPEVRSGITLSFEPDLETTQKWFDRIAIDETRADWVAVDERNEPMAMCGLTKIRDGGAELYIYVNPQQIGQGYGRETMQLLIARARKQGVSRLYLQTKRENTRSQRLYESLGFRVARDAMPAQAMVPMTLVLNSSQSTA